MFHIIQFPIAFVVAPCSISTAGLAQLLRYVPFAVYIDGDMESG